ncbi:MAG: hypothetical protein QM674_09305 [Burkholderiaceae bacterium]
MIVVGQSVERCPVHSSDAADALLPAWSGGYRFDSPDLARVYGPGRFILDGLWNVNAERRRGVDVFPAIRFRAPFDGTIASVRLYWSDGRGYAGGDGGDIAIRLLPDDGSARHLPDWSAAPLARGRRRPGAMSMRDGHYRTRADRFAPDPLSGEGGIEAGRFYHLVAINEAIDPASNWSSWDMAYTIEANGRPGRWLHALELSTLVGRRASGDAGPPDWEDWTTDGHGGAYVAPIIEVALTDGRRFGNANMETGNVDAGGRLWKNGAANPVRERFRPCESHTITGLSINTGKIDGIGGLGWQIRLGASVLAEGIIEQAQPNYRVDDSVGSAGVMTWYDVALRSPIRFEAGRTYDVTLTPRDGSTWAFADQRNGSRFGFQPPVAFTESRAQHYQLGLWIDANHWAKRWPGRGANWRIVLHRAP